MQEQNSFYPVRIISRSVAKRRSRRVSWFVLGTGFGVGCAFALSTMLTSTASPSWFASRPAASEENTTQTAELHMTTGIDVTAPALPAPVAKPKPAAPIYPLALNLKVEDGDTLINILTDTGVSYEEAHSAVDSIAKVYNVRKLDIGQNVAMVLDKGPEDSTAPIISSIRLPVSNVSTVEIVRSKNAKSGNFEVKKIDAAVENKLARAGGRIDSSLYETGVATGMPVGVLSEIISAYSYDVDFQREIQPGDMMDVLFERLQTKDGVVAGHGNVLFAELNLSGRTMKIYRYVDKAGNVDYYNEKGESVRKALLRTPVNGAKITSGYGMRNHPILGYSKMHRGVDFGAPTGTPIYAAGDGTVEFVGRKGGYGNYLRIKHNNKYESAYGHISRFASGVAPGKKVRQGQIVAYVGATGMATGPHLHYEILVNNTQVNPTSVKFKTGNVLLGKEMASFRKSMDQIEAKLANTPRDKTDLASAE